MGTSDSSLAQEVNGTEVQAVWSNPIGNPANPSPVALNQQLRVVDN